MKLSGRALAYVSLIPSTAEVGRRVTITCYYILGIFTIVEKKKNPAPELKEIPNHMVDSRNLQLCLAVIIGAG